MYVLLLNHFFDLSILQAKNFHILFCLLIEYVLYSLPSLSFFRLGFAHAFYTPAPPYCGGFCCFNLVVGGCS